MITSGNCHHEFLLSLFTVRVESFEPREEEKEFLLSNQVTFGNLGTCHCIISSKVNYELTVTVVGKYVVSVNVWMCVLCSLRLLQKWPGLTSRLYFIVSLNSYINAVTSELR